MAPVPVPAAGRTMGRLHLLAGLCSAGVLTVGVALLAGKGVAGLIGGPDLTRPNGPAWLRIAAHLLTGAVGEGVRHLRCTGRWRIALDLVVTIGCLTVVFLLWW